MARDFPKARPEYRRDGQIECILITPIAFLQRGI